ncbi:MAG: PD-(D/E)XK nuclease family protein, partial [Phycisphaeraceae bacterium]|nr:PD-(D/E)XK nuclease family protein [Phycisphaeraceae bacterium]
VTALRDYLACPYRFYLKYIEELEPFTEGPAELDAMSFGNLAHEVLAEFGREQDLSASTQSRAIEAFLHDRLDRTVERHYGPKPPAAVRLQQEQLRHRLSVLAERQAERAAAGWRILPAAIEADAEKSWTIEGSPLTIRGRIDRIDVHPEHGCCILDYKTSDRGQTPEQTHHKGQGAQRQWTDLQLPLYRELARPILAANKLGGASVSLGYVRLPKKTADIGFRTAGWSTQDVDEAVDRAREVMTLIRRGVFWPPSEPVDFEDGLEGLCMDGCLDRQAVIDTRQRQHAPAGRKEAKR